MGWARWEGHNSPMKCQPRNLKRTEQDVGMVYEETSDGRCMEWGIWEAGRQSPAPAFPRRCQWWGRLYLRLGRFTPYPNGSDSILGALDLEDEGAGNWQLLLGSKVMREAKEAFLWHQVYHRFFPWSIEECNVANRSMQWHTGWCSECKQLYTHKLLCLVMFTATFTHTVALGWGTGTWHRGTLKDSEHEVY